MYGERPPPSYAPRPPPGTWSRAAWYSRYTSGSPVRQKHSQSFCMSIPQTSFWNSLRMLSDFMAGNVRFSAGGFRHEILLVPVAEASHIVHVVPPVCPIKSLILWGPRLYLSGQAEPARSKVSLRETLVRRDAAARFRSRKTGTRLSGTSLIPVVTVTRKTVTQSHISWPE